MSSFRQLLAKPTSDEDLVKLDSYQRVLGELADAITEHYPHLTARAVLEPFHTSMSSSLLVLRVFWPPETEEMALDAMQFKVTSGGVIEAFDEEGQTSLESESALRAFLEDATRETLRSSLQMLEREARAPFTATLRTTEANMLAANDTIVGFGVEARNRLKSGDNQVSIEVAEAYPRRLNRFRPGVVPYTYLTGQYGTWRVVEQPKRIEGSDQYELELERVS